MARTMQALLLAVNLLCVVAGPHSRQLHTRQATNRTSDSLTLKTWWHASGEINTDSPVKDDNVRQSHLYSIEIATASSPDDFFNSFVYESIPRNGNGKICVPGDLQSLCDTDDQISIEPDLSVDMAWTQYLSSEDTIVRVSMLNGDAVANSGITIRPTNLRYSVSYVDGAALISVPSNPNGVRFSVEIQDNLWEYRSASAGNSYYVQNENPDGQAYVSSYDDSMPILGLEPRNALMIFASPFPDQNLVPNDEANTLRVSPGLVTDLDKTTKSIVYFEPGVYYMTGKNHAILSSTVTWVYIAPGAYVKGAIQYTSSAPQLKATGFGVLSGEQYVYQANPAKGYINEKSDATSLKMWRGENIAEGASWTMHGLTTNAPPFNSMDFYGATDAFRVFVSDYKQVGAFFGQTDGIQMYPNSHVHDVFYHAGDDVIKTYYSNVIAERIVVWKTNNAPIVQFGWYARDLTNVTVDRVDLIHSRYISQNTLYPRALVGSAVSYEDPESTQTANINLHLSDYTISNWRSEGSSPALLGINPLVNVDTFLIENVWIEKLGPSSTGIDMSTLRVWTDGNNGNAAIKLGDSSPDNLGLTIRDYRVGDTKITRAAGNWDSFSLGRLNIDGAYDGRWAAI